MSRHAASTSLAGQRVLVVGKLSSMSRREAQAVLREAGVELVESLADAPHAIVLGEQHSLDRQSALAGLDPSLRRAVETGQAVLVSEVQLWQQLGLVETQQQVQQLYTPAMLAGLLAVPVAVVRQWHRRGLIVPRREVRRLAYFDFGEVAVARRLAELHAAGVSPAAIERKLSAVRRSSPALERPLAEPGVLVEGRQVLLRSGERLLEPGGQLRIDFDQLDEDQGGEPSAKVARVLPLEAPRPALVGECSPDAMLQAALDLEDAGELVRAAEMYRSVMAALGPRPEICFRLAELLYQAGDLAGARERYHMAIELDEDYVEARANLGCVLAESGDEDLAVAAFEGALELYPDYADVRYLLARILDRLGRAAEAAVHWRRFLMLAPDSPWADEARVRLTD
jgi:tetratricopeptide (TPR) repeat protein